MKPLIAATALLVLISPALAIAQSPPSAEMRDSDEPVVADYRSVSAGGGAMLTLRF